MTWKTLLLLIPIAFLSACSSLPESAYYRYTPDPAGKPPAKISGKVEYQAHTFYSLGLVTPVAVELAGVDGLYVKSGKAEVAAGKHIFLFKGSDYDNEYLCSLQADLKPGVEYVAKASKYLKGKPSPLFYIEERATKRRIIEGPADRKIPIVRIYI